MISDSGRASCDMLRRVDLRTLANGSMIAVIEAVTARGFSLRFQARGMSMDPVIRDGDCITLAPPGKNHLPCGQVVAFSNPITGILQVHRIWLRVRGRYLIKGDHLAKPDGWVTPDRLLGVVAKVERNGTVVDFQLGPVWSLFWWLVSLVRPLGTVKRMLFS